MGELEQFLLEHLEGAKDKLQPRIYSRKCQLAHKLYFS